mgnify:CR=1 FL=1
MGDAYKYFFFWLSILMCWFIKLRGKQIRIKTLLTKHNATLLEQAYTLKGKPFEFVWETDGKIFVRVKEGGRATVIRSLEQLSKLAADNTTA